MTFNLYDNPTGKVVMLNHKRCALKPILILNLSKKMPDYVLCFCPIPKTVPWQPNANINPNRHPYQSITSRDKAT